MAARNEAACRAADGSTGGMDWTVERVRAIRAKPREASDRESSNSTLGKGRGEGKARAFGGSRRFRRSLPGRYERHAYEESGSPAARRTIDSPGGDRSPVTGGRARAHALSVVVSPVIGVMKDKIRQLEAERDELLASWRKSDSAEALAAAIAARKPRWRGWLKGWLNRELKRPK